MIELSEGELLYHKIETDRFPLSFCRQVLADLHGMPNRIDWKSCVLDVEQEKLCCLAFRERFTPYEPSALPDIDSSLPSPMIRNVDDRETE